MLEGWHFHYAVQQILEEPEKRGMEKGNFNQK